MSNKVIDLDESDAEEHAPIVDVLAHAEDAEAEFLEGSVFADFDLEDNVDLSADEDAAAHMHDDY